MIITDITLKKLEPSPNMKLTNGIDVAENEVYLGDGDNADNWYEITIEEYENILREKEYENEEMNYNNI